MIGLNLFRCTNPTLRRRLAACLFSITSTTNCIAAPAADTHDNDQPAHIEADTVDIDDAREVSVYRGDVRYRQGSRHLTADEVTIHTKDLGRIKKIIAVGNPATFVYRPEHKTENLNGSALRIEYQSPEFFPNEQLTLHGEAHLEHGRVTFSGDRVDYNMTTDYVKAYSTPTRQQRVKTTFTPQKSNK